MNTFIHSLATPAHRRAASRRAATFAASALVTVGLLAGCAVPEPRESDSGVACANAVDARYELPAFSGPRAAAGFDALAARHADVDVVFVGERHTSLADHLHQLATICAFERLDGPLLVGLEAVQWPFQRHLDDFVAGRIDTDTMLERIEYYDRWRYDFRLLEPVFELARRGGVRLVALNAPAELTRAVARRGVEGLDDDLRAQLPDAIDRSSGAYAARLEAVFSAHGAHGGGNTDPDRVARFTDAQRVWDETMAERAIAALRAEPGARMVVLAGTGHVSHENTIPARIERRSDLRTLVLSPPAPGAPVSAEVVRLDADELALPPTGKLGVYLNPTGEGDGVGVEALVEDGAAAAAGIEAGDRILAIDERPVSSVAAIRIALRSALPGETRRLEVWRAEAASSTQVELTLR